MLDSNQTRDMKLLRLMGQERRFQVLLLLCKRQMSHEEICLALGKPMGVYKHLKGMVEAGLLIRTDITSRDVVYRANPKVLEEVGMCLQDMATDAHEISFRIAHGIPDEEMDEKPAHADRRFEEVEAVRDTHREEQRRARDAETGRCYDLCIAEDDEWGRLNAKGLEEEQDERAQRRAQIKTTPDEDSGDPERKAARKVTAEQLFEKLADMGKVYGRKPEDIMPDVDDATRREMMAILGDEIKPAELSQEEIDNAAALYEETKLDDE
ncbi:hypothetical protein LCGC14_0276240 [marine sediment metagenome]|uniref:HTH arsR-type domain-containing protein n=1 Tax=marine sediment metagenome TaxID=412755 RepID=A0A0F9UEQ2_9ZZZZ